MNSQTDLTQRLEYYGIVPARAADRGAAAAIRRFGKRALARFYDRVGRTPATSGFFTSEAMAQGASEAQRQHWLGMFEQGLDAAYLERANRIGMVHARIGLEPRWYIGGYANILADVMTGMIAGGAKAAIPGRQALARDVTRLLRVAMLDMDIALSTYFVKAEDDVRTTMMSKIDVSLAAMADGDLSHRVAGLPAGFESLESNFNQAMDQLEGTIGQVTTASDTIASGASEIRAASDDLARRTEQQAASLEESTAALSQINTMAKETARDVQSLRDAVSHAHREAETGSEVVRNATSAMSDIQSSARQIAQIIAIIDGIAFQTNLLALNAGVEAARVGEEGKGFAVVANEVRALAARSAEAAEEIKSLVSESLRYVDRGVELVDRTGSVLGAILGQVGDINAAAARINDASLAQSANLAQVHQSVVEMDRMTQQNAAMVEESNAAARAMAGEAERLVGVVGHFQVNGTATSSDRKMLRRAA